MISNIKEIQEKIEQQVQEQKEDFNELVLDQISFHKFTPEIVNALEKHKDGLLLLTLNDCSIDSLDNFPDLPKLIRLELLDNKFNGKDLKELSKFKDLQSLSLGGNQIQNYEELQPLCELPTLVQLDLFGCPISDKPDYREKIFSMFKSLEILDNQDAEGKDFCYDDDSEEEEENEEKEEKEEDVEEKNYGNEDYDKED